MTAEQIIGLSLALIVMCVGLVGSILPGIPGTPLVLLAAIGHRLYFGEHGASLWIFGILLGLTLLSIAIDYLASMYGAKKLGATGRGIFGAVVGGIIGLFFSLPGIILGPFLGALAFELAGGRQLKDASLAGVGAVLGLLGGALGKLLCCLMMITAFAVNVIWRSGS
ncbi:MAG: DUF456 domain-containing protein [Verrucomicrobiota bacterium]